jgi:ATP-binding cassette subfamily B protein
MIQRISTVQHADKILVLDKGEVVASGTHAELMEESSIYAEIYIRSWWATLPGTCRAGRAG